MASSLARQIKKMIEKQGAPAAHEYASGPPVYDPLTRTNTTPTGTQTVHVIIDSTSLVSLGEIFGEDLVMSGDLNVSFHALYANVPKEGDFLTVDGEKRELLSRKPIHFKKGEIVMWKGLVRSGQREGAKAAVV